MHLLSKLHSSCARKLNKLRDFKKDSEGVAAVEFALIAPILLLLFIGTIEVSLMIAVDRKISRTSSAIADLIAQGGFAAGSSETEIRAIFGMTDRIMFPYTNRIPCVVISKVIANAESDTNGDGVLGDGDNIIARVDASIDNSTPNASYTSPEAGQCNKSNNKHGSELIVAEVEYDHKPIVGVISSNGTGNINIEDGLFTLGDRIFLRPRQAVDFPTN